VKRGGVKGSSLNGALLVVCFDFLISGKVFFPVTFSICPLCRREQRRPDTTPFPTDTSTSTTMFQHGRWEVFLWRFPYVDNYAAMITTHTHTHSRYDGYLLERDLIALRVQPIFFFFFFSFIFSCSLAQAISSVAER
jgi:hypothetical protein